MLIVAFWILKVKIHRCICCLLVLNQICFVYILSKNVWSNHKIRIETRLFKQTEFNKWKEKWLHGWIKIIVLFIRLQRKMFLNILCCDTHKDCTLNYVINEIKFLNTKFDKINAYLIWPRIFLLFFMLHECTYLRAMMLLGKYHLFRRKWRHFLPI